MPTLYVENVPEDLYSALRERAASNHRSMAAEVLELLHQFVPTKKEIARRQRVLKLALRMQARKPKRPGPSAEEMLREDRMR